MDRAEKLGTQEDCGVYTHRSISVAEHTNNANITKIDRVPPAERMSFSEGLTRLCTWCTVRGGLATMPGVESV